MLADILGYITSEINSLNLGMTAVIGSLPASNGIAVSFGAGSPSDEFLDRGKEHGLFVTVNDKNADQAAALNALEDVHQYFTQLKVYPPGSDYQIINIATGSSPNYLGKDANNQQWLYGSILKITVNQNGVI